MKTNKHYRTRAVSKGTPSNQKSGEIQRYFRQELSPGARAAAPRGPPRELTHQASARGSQTSTENLLTLPNRTPETPESAIIREMSSTHPAEPAPMDPDIRALLQALPTKNDIEAMILRLEETHRRDIQEVRGEVSSLADRVASGETAVSSLEERISALEQARDLHRDTAVSLQLHMEDVEDRSRRNNLRLRGIPEAVDAEHLAEAVKNIFRTVLDEADTDIELDRVHRTLGPRPTDPSNPRDVVCRLHRYLQKEAILRRAWEHGDVDHNESRVRILPDLSRATLKRRAMLRPLLDLAKQKGFTYRWGYPLSVTFRNDTAAFTLQTATDLPELFRFFDAPPISVPDWLQILPRPIGRSGPSAARGPLPPRQRGRRRRRSASGGAERE